MTRPHDYEVFEQALTLFHHYSLQNSETVHQLQDQGILPTVHRRGFAILDIGAGQGYLPSLMQEYAETLVLLEPNPHCVKVLRQRFQQVYPYPWGQESRALVRQDWPEGFDLITMSHMLYHFNGIDDIRDKVRMALSLLKPEGNLAIIINQPSAPMACAGIRFQREEGRLDEAATNRQLHASCHAASFYRDLAGGPVEVDIHPIDTPLRQVQSRSDLITLFRMPLLNPLSEAPCDTDRLDAFIAHYLDTEYPGLAYPATIPSRDDLIILRKSPALLYRESA
jgi:SAM-dependent methyltransferase